MTQDLIEDQDPEILWYINKNSVSEEFTGKQMAEKCCNILWNYNTNPHNIVY